MTEPGYFELGPILFVWPHDDGYSGINNYGIELFDRLQVEYIGGWRFSIHRTGKYKYSRNKSLLLFVGPLAIDLIWRY